MTIRDTTHPTVAVIHAVMGGIFRLRLRDTSEAEVLDDDGQVIGYASTYPYNGNAWSVHTRPFAGYVPLDQVEIVA